jgi:hypothetical protein
MKTILFRSLLPFFAFCAGHQALAAPDGFDAIQCGADIPKALLGKTLRNEKVSVLEARHKAIGLKDLGAMEISDRVFAISWLVCGQEFMLLQDKRDVVRDVLPVPTHSKANPEYIGTCSVNGKELSGQMVAILENEKGNGDLPAKAAWKIDEAKARFVKVPETGLRCPRDGIITADGGL